MNEHCKSDLVQIKNLLNKLKTDQYTFPVSMLSYGTIGQHVRHILEFYVGLIHGVEKRIVHYDDRARNLKLETDKDYGIIVIDDLIKKINVISSDFNMILGGNFSLSSENSIEIKTSYYRELAYCYEHSIHHKALIKIALKVLKIQYLIDNDFGVAPATIRFNKLCAQ